MVAKVELTYEDYAKTPDDVRYELIGGELTPMPSPKWLHQLLLTRLLMPLYVFTHDRGLGEVVPAPMDVVLSDTDVVQPDVIFVSNERAHIITEDNIRGAPDLLVEILSPSTSERDRTVKRDLYARHGVREYWLVDPHAKSVTALMLVENRFALSGVYGEGQTLTSPTLEGFSLDLDELF